VAVVRMVEDGFDFASLSKKFHGRRRADHRGNGRQALVIPTEKVCAGGAGVRPGGGPIRPRAVPFHMSASRNTQRVRKYPHSGCARVDRQAARPRVPTGTHMGICNLPITSFWRALWSGYRDRTLRASLRSTCSGRRMVNARFSITRRALRTAPTATVWQAMPTDAGLKGPAEYSVRSTIDWPGIGHGQMEPSSSFDALLEELSRGMPSGVGRQNTRRVTA